MAHTYTNRDIRHGAAKRIASFFGHFDLYFSFILSTGIDLIIQFAFIIQLYAYIVIMLHNLLFIWTPVALNVLYVHS